MLDARFSHLYFCQSLNRLQGGLSAIAELLVMTVVTCNAPMCMFVIGALECRYDDDDEKQNMRSWLIRRPLTKYKIQNFPCSQILQSVHK